MPTSAIPLASAARTASAAGAETAMTMPAPIAAPSHRDALGDGVERILSELQVVAYDIPRKSMPAIPRGAMASFRLALCRGQQGSRSEVCTGAYLRDAVPEILESGEIPGSAT
jgi:hypothetical protein